VRERVDVPVLTQRDLPKTALIEKFSSEESSCLFATAGSSKAWTYLAERFHW
jgi:ATP-dependent DNA helicase DinG